MLKTANATAETCVKPQVVIYGQILEEITATNEKLVAELEERLRSILRSDPEVAVEKSKTVDPLVPMADYLHAIANIAQRTNAALNSILRRIEI